MPTIRITKDNLTGGAATAPIIIALAQGLAKISAAVVADLVDSSGGAAPDGVMGAVALCTTAPAVGANVPTKAAAETALGLVKDGLMEIAAQVVAVALRVPLFVPVNNIGGTAADRTIGAITVAPTADNVGPRVAFAGFNASLTQCRQVLQELEVDVNALMVGCGVAPLTGKATTSLAGLYDRTYAAISTATGTAPVDSSGSVTVAESTASLTALRDGIAELAARLNLVTTDTAPISVVIAG
jgi:hypothetical protein